MKQHAHHSPFRLSLGRILGLLALFVCAPAVHAQEWMNIHQHNDVLEWTVPMRMDHMGDMNTTSSVFSFPYLRDIEGEAQNLLFSLSRVDSIIFSRSLSDEEKGHDKYRVFTLHIRTEHVKSIADKETWVNCHIAVDGMGEYSPFSGMAKIRGRGNSTWEWYDKKPYKFKLDEKSKLLGMEKARNWNLLANFRDMTDLMNVVAFEGARCMGMPFTNHSRFVEVILNDEYIGLYQLTEKIEVGSNRVDISKEDGILLSFDRDDGPSLSPGATNNFSSRIYGLPISVKHPDEVSPEKLDSVREELAVIERAIKAHNYPLVDSLVDIPSLISLLQLHEYLYNVEIDAPRSIYAFRDKGGKLTFGPVWDWDAAFDFDWGTMYTGHKYFSDYRELIYGTSPATGDGASYRVSGFWTDMFKDASFVTRYKEQWRSVKDSLYTSLRTEIYRYLNVLKKGPYQRDTQRWGIKTHNPEVEVGKMITWLERRMNYLTPIIEAYPAGTPSVPVDPSEGDGGEDGGYTEEGGNIVVTRTLDIARGYTQTGTISLSKDDVSRLLGATPNELYPLNANLSVGENTAAGRYGAWFDANGNTNGWNAGHVYVESDDLYTWHYGCHPDNCRAGHTHTVRMRYARGKRTLDVIIHFIVR